MIRSQREVPASHIWLEKSKQHERVKRRQQERAAVDPMTGTLNQAQPTSSKTSASPHLVPKVRTMSRAFDSVSTNSRTRTATTPAFHQVLSLGKAIKLAKTHHRRYIRVDLDSDAQTWTRRTPNNNQFKMVPMNCTEGLGGRKNRGTKYHGKCSEQPPLTTLAEKIYLKASQLYDLNRHGEDGGIASERRFQDEKSSSGGHRSMAWAGSLKNAFYTQSAVVEVHPGPAGSGIGRFGPSKGSSVFESKSILRRLELEPCWELEWCRGDLVRRRSGNIILSMELIGSSKFNSVQLDQTSGECSGMAEMPCAIPGSPVEAAYIKDGDAVVDNYTLDIGRDLACFLLYRKAE
ncbi:hypothetical protein GGX14DRAFT_388747 [Mycena pura]|uniref:Uncharacterized protein n=1 Tax=Mycena pura TaxID=153505 RepID=A0AAD6YKP3_9AGAR|nr:hypothetical protein GGX14DRAFT_388747 [Mycena pura]